MIAALTFAMMAAVLLAGAMTEPLQNGRRLFLAAATVCVIVAGTSAAYAGNVHIPHSSLRYRMALEQAAGAHFGLNAPVARLAAQVHQESYWNPKAQSPYATGLSQFTPSTAKWMPTVCPGLSAPDPWNPYWSIRAMACLGAWLHARAPGDTPCARWAMTLSAYNGGAVARRIERDEARQAGADPGLWFGNVARFRAKSARSVANWKQNRHYVRRILLVLEPAYIHAGWPGTEVCHAHR